MAWYSVAQLNVCVCMYVCVYSMYVCVGGGGGQARNSFLYFSTFWARTGLHALAVSHRPPERLHYLVFLRVDGMSVLTFPGTGADSALHGRSVLGGMSVLTFPENGADSPDQGRSGLDGMSVLTFPGTGADSGDHGRSGVDGISLPTFPVTGAELLVHSYFGDDGISLPKYAFADASSIIYSATNAHSKFYSSSSPYFFPNLPLHL